MVYDFTLEKRVTAGPSPVDAAGQMFRRLVRSFPMFWTSHLAGVDNHSDRKFNVFRPPVNPCDFTCRACMLLFDCKCLFYTSGSTP